MSDFKKAGGVLEGRGERYDAFEGEPRSVGGALSGGGVQTNDRNGSNSNMLGGATSAMGNTTHGHRGSGSSSSSDEGKKQNKPSMMDKLNPKVDADGDGKAGMMS